LKYGRLTFLINNNYLAHLYGKNMVILHKLILL
jgi:hypothetical protein